MAPELGAVLAPRCPLCSQMCALRGASQSVCLRRMIARCSRWNTVARSLQDRYSCLYSYQVRGHLCFSCLSLCTSASCHILTEISLFSISPRPAGYPTSVSPDYLRYYTWQFVQGLCSTITNMLSAKATLEGLGVGEAGAAAATATLFLALKDAVGRIASIGFAWWQGSQLDCNAKRWRLIADVANDIGILVELIAPLVAMYTAWWVFVVLLSLANVARAVAGVAGGATRVSMVQHFALKDNIGDLSAKAGSQEVRVIIALSTLANIYIPSLLQLDCWWPYWDDSRHADHCAGRRTRQVGVGHRAFLYCFTYGACPLSCATCCALLETFSYLGHPTNRYLCQLAVAQARCSEDHQPTARSLALLFLLYFKDTLDAKVRTTLRGSHPLIIIASLLLPFKRCECARGYLDTRLERHSV